MILTAEVDEGQSVDPRDDRASATCLGGLIWTLVPGLDADLGYQAEVHGASVRQWLAGLTYRFAL